MKTKPEIDLYQGEYFICYYRRYGAVFIGEYKKPNNSYKNPRQTVREIISNCKGLFTLGETYGFPIDSEIIGLKTSNLKNIKENHPEFYL